MLPNLLALYNSQISQCSNIITILSHLMRIIPKHVLLTELPKVSICTQTTPPLLYHTIAPTNITGIH